MSGSSIVVVFWISTTRFISSMSSWVRLRAAHCAAGISRTRRTSVISSMLSAPMRTMVSMDSLSIWLSESGVTVLTKLPAGNAGDLADEARADKGTQRLAHRRPTDAELLRQLGLSGELLALREVTLEDGFAQL